MSPVSNQVGSHDRDASAYDPEDILHFSSKSAIAAPYQLQNVNIVPHHRPVIAAPAQKRRKVKNDKQSAKPDARLKLS